MYEGPSLSWAKSLPSACVLWKESRHSHLLCAIVSLKGAMERIKGANRLIAYPSSCNAEQG